MRNDQSASMLATSSLLSRVSILMAAQIISQGRMNRIPAAHWHRRTWGPGWSFTGCKVRMISDRSSFPFGCYLCVTSELELSPFLSRFCHGTITFPALNLLCLWAVRSETITSFYPVRWFWSDFTWKQRT